MGIESISQAGAVLALASLVIGFTLGVVFGRGRGGNKQRMEELEGELRDTQEQLNEAQSQMSEQTERVSAHFGRTSDLLKAMTMQYRSLYEHLAEGANSLAPTDSAHSLANGDDSLLLDFDEEVAESAAKEATAEKEPEAASPS